MASADLTIIRNFVFWKSWYPSPDQLVTIHEKHDSADKTESQQKKCCFCSIPVVLSESMETKRISLDFDDEDMAVLDKAQEIARKKFGCKSTGASIRAILRDYVAAHERGEEPK
jgi:hypothetical protein